MRFTATYAFTPAFSAGLEVNPLANDLGLLANWRLLDETAARPAFIVGTSSDRIGTPSGRAYYGTFSKDLSAWTGLPIAPYAGAAWGTFDDELVAIGGLAVSWGAGFTSTHLWDGHNLHHTLDRRLGRGLRIGLVVAQQDSRHYLGLSFGAGSGPLRAALCSEEAE